MIDERPEESTPSPSGAEDRSLDEATEDLDVTEEDAEDIRGGLTTIDPESGLYGKKCK